MDIVCAVCSEPWDFYGIRTYGDTTRWQTELILLGAGCPCCEGYGERSDEKDTNFLDTYNSATDTCLAFDLMCSGIDRSIKWARPKPTILKTCANCEVSICKDAEGDLIITNGNCDIEQNWIEVEGKEYCNCCARYCYGCDCACPNDSTNECECYSVIFTNGAEDDLAEGDVGFSVEDPNNPYNHNVCYACATSEELWVTEV